MDAVDSRVPSLGKPSPLGRVYAPGIRTSLAMLVVGCVLPIAIVSTFLMLRVYETEQAQLATRAIGRARAIVASLDRDFGRTEASLQALATSRRLVNDDLGGFHVRAVEALRNMDADSIVVMNLDGQLLLSTRRPFGTLLPKLTRTPLLARVLRTGEPAVSDLYLGPIVGKLIFTIAVPVRVNGTIVLLLNATAAPAQSVDVLSDQALPRSWHATITDSGGSVAARTHDIGNFLGKKINPWALEQMARANEGVFETTAADGTPFITAYSRSTRTRWSAILDIPLNQLTAELRHTLNLLIGATIAALAFGLALAWFIGGRIANSITALTKPALALATGEQLAFPPLHFKEANDVSKALLDASSALRQSNYDAHHDVLTGLPNRALFQIVVSQQLALCQRSKTELAILYIDLDGFKAVNDAHGHSVGDQLLHAVATRIDASIRTSDIAARFGGDEFAIALTSSGLDHASLFSERLIDTLSTPYQLSGAEANISASIGVAGYPVSATDIDALIDKADQAMYTAKALGKKRYCVAEPA
jgi:diguanylate cyclase (GGDEF)-like protein